MATNFPAATVVGQTFTDLNSVVWTVTYLTPTRWERTRTNDAAGIPLSGTAGQVLTKQSNTDFDNVWTTLTPGQTAGGLTAEVFTKQSGTDFDSNWQAAPNDLPAGGTTGQLLKTNDGGNVNVAWVSDSGGLESGTKFIFLDATVPTGWTPDPSITDRMMRIMSVSGGTLAGSHDPISDDKAKSHNHTGTLSAGGSTHTHGGPGGANFWVDPGGNLVNGGVGSSNHTEATTATASSTHIHTVTITATAGDGAWTPKYKDSIIGIKN